ncbi:DUF1801 domain-containing protein [Microbacterium aoyamense]|uniref:DUF1801 domain-containing protein n=1 Tax=Microbacterium aoyamense TaxID=344166 RepID=UPI0020067B25|nr:DUF1801 domain-containing protein [Microbacterium aoyamense]
MSVEQSVVDAWFDEQSHAMTDAAREVRASILRVVPAATESIKWQAPNFALDDDFATFSMRRPGVLQVILHTGAKPKPERHAIELGDLGGRLRWAGHNRAVITFTSPEDVTAALPQFEREIARWAGTG